MKGQGYFGFIISAVMMLMVISYVTLAFINKTGPEIERVIESKKQAKAYEIAKTLLRERGYWSGGSDWENHIAEAERIGLAEDYGFLSKKKIEALEKISRDELKNIFGGGNNYLICIGENCDIVEVKTSDVVSAPDEKALEVPVIISDGRVTKMRVVVQ